jgi:thioredoxin-like negative regulator of GroEL
MDGEASTRARTWRAGAFEQGERLLREQQNSPYERDVRLSVAVSYVVLGRKDKAARLLKALVGDKGTLEGRWAERFLALQGW